MLSPPPVPGSLGVRALDVVTRLHVAAYRLTEGRLAGAPVLLLGHVGARSVARRTTPLLLLADGDDLVIVGARGGSRAPPA